jgi:hypothetical protein
VVDRAGLWLVVLVGLVVLGSPAALVAGGDSLRGPDYVGGAPGFPRAKFTLDISKPQSKSPRIRFQAKEVFVHCDDDNDSLRSFPALTFRLDSNNFFAGSHYRLEPDGFQSYYKVQGHVRPGQPRARGWIVYVETPFDPAGGPQRPDCSTAGRFHWRAEARK